jgi:hypothetical protein
MHCHTWKCDMPRNPPAGVPQSCRNEVTEAMEKKIHVDGKFFLRVSDSAKFEENGCWRWRRYFVNSSLVALTPAGTSIRTVYNPGVKPSG